MKIGIIGAGNVGSALALRLGQLGHAVRIANSRGPATLSRVAEDTGATPVSVAEVAKGVDLLVVATPISGVAALPKALLDELPAGSPIVDACNYIPPRDGVIDEIEAGLTESEWTARVLKQPVVKAFNNITTHSIVHGGLPKGSDGRIALPVSGDDADAKQVVIALLDALGFDGVDAGPLSESWRQQPGTPAYATDHDAATLRSARASADRTAAPGMRDETLRQLFSLPPDTQPHEVIRLARALWA